MKSIRQSVLLILLLVMGNSCITYKNLEKVKPITDSASMGEELQKLKPGDKIMVFEKSGSVKSLEYVVTEKGQLRGLDSRSFKGDLISIKIEDIEKVQVKKVNAKKIVLFTLGPIAAAYLTIGILLIVTGRWP